MKSRIMLIAATVMVLLCFSMVGCNSVPRQTIVIMPQAGMPPVIESRTNHIKYELKESFDIKDDQQNRPVMTAAIGFSQSW